MARRGSRQFLKALLAALPLAALVPASAALAQVPAGEDGRALDANPRVGSGGVNSNTVPSPWLVNQIRNNNRIVTGNVTGGREFRGIVQARDPREFRGGVAGEETDRFIRNSSGVPRPYGGPSNQFTSPFDSQIFYGRALAAPSQLPPDFSAVGSTGTFTPTPPQQQQPPADPTRIDALISSQLRPADLLIPGPVDPRTGLPVMITASPLMGVRQFDITNAQDLGFLNGFSAARSDNALQRLHLDQRTLQLMRDELQELVRPGGAANPALGPGGQDLVTQRAPGSISAAAVTPFETPENPNLAGQALPGAEPLSATVGRRPEPQLVPPARLSAQYADLEERLARYYTERFSADEAANAEFLRQLRQPRAGSAAGPAAAGGSASAGATVAAAVSPEYARMARALADAAAAAARGQGGGFRPPPTRIQSLAQGVTAPNLAALLRRAEEALRAGKPADALRQYQAATELAPNNQMILLGRAHAELASGYYLRAEQHIRTALISDPVLLVAQFDLPGMVGGERLTRIVSDLKDAALRQQNDAGFALLLAYIAYNSGNADQARVYVDLMDKRTGGKDALVRRLRTHWQLPGDPRGPAPDPAPATRPVIDITPAFERPTTRPAGAEDANK